MRILDTNNVEITAPDLALGHLEKDRVFVRHHDAIAAVDEVGHYEVVAEYPETGGKDVKWVVDVVAVPAREAWDEYEEIMRYVMYSPQELEAMNQPSLDERVSALETDIAEALSMILSGVTE